MLLDSQQWGLCIVQGFDVVRCLLSISFSLALSTFSGMVADDLGRTTGGSLRTSWIVFMWLIVVLGLLPSPPLTDLVRETLSVPSRAKAFTKRNEEQRDSD